MPFYITCIAVHIQYHSETDVKINTSGSIDNHNPSSLFDVQKIPFIDANIYPNHIILKKCRRYFAFLVSLSLLQLCDALCIFISSHS